MGASDEELARQLAETKLKLSCRMELNSQMQRARQGDRKRKHDGGMRDKTKFPSVVNQPSEKKVASRDDGSKRKRREEENNFPLEKKFRDEKSKSNAKRRHSDLEDKTRISSRPLKKNVLASTHEEEGKQQETEVKIKFPPVLAQGKQRSEDGENSKRNNGKGKHKPRFHPYLGVTGKSNEGADNFRINSVQAYSSKKKDTSSQLENDDKTVHRQVSENIQAANKLRSTVLVHPTKIESQTQEEDKLQVETLSTTVIVEHSTEKVSPRPHTPTSDYQEARLLKTTEETLPNLSLEDLTEFFNSTAAEEDSSINETEAAIRSIQEELLAQTTDLPLLYKIEAPAQVWAQAQTADLSFSNQDEAAKQTEALFSPNEIKAFPPLFDGEIEAIAQETKEGYSETGTDLSFSTTKFKSKNRITAAEFRNSAWPEAEKRNQARFDKVEHDIQESTKTVLEKVQGIHTVVTALVHRFEQLSCHNAPH